MNYKFFTNSEKTWRAMFADMQNARESIYFEMYIFKDDMMGFDFPSLLKQKARSGVRVRIILDSFGSKGLSNEAVNSLRESGVELFFVSHFFHRIHRKVLVIDEQVAFIGGVNFHESAKHWNDLSVRVKGKIVLSIIRSFARVYADCGGKDPLILIKNKKVILDKMSTWLVEHSPVRRKFGFKKVYKKHLSRAEKSITLVTPYFMPKRWLTVLLHQAVLRGVYVEILVPKNTDIFIVDRVNNFYMRKVARLGVSVYVEEHMNHAKVMLVDKKEGIIGSQNLDFLSFDLNSEVGVFFTDPDSIQKLDNIINEWKKGAVLFDFKDYKPKWFDYILSPIISLFSKII